MPKNNEQLSKYIAFLLRHHPETIGLLLDEHGWADAYSLIEGICRTKDPGFTFERLEEIVKHDKKGRYVFDEDKKKIRACQGHSVKVDVEPEEADPPCILFHGTATRFESSIEEKGLLSGSRLYVHLSPDIQTAVQVGSRHGKPVVYAIDTIAMKKDGLVFCRAHNGVWLTSHVPAKYLKKIEVRE